jgi:hypothetical protein
MYEDWVLILSIPGPEEHAAKAIYFIVGITELYLLWNAWATSLAVFPGRDH